MDWRPKSIVVVVVVVIKTNRSTRLTKLAICGEIEPLKKLNPSCLHIYIMNKMEEEEEEVSYSLNCPVAYSWFDCMIFVSTNRNVRFVKEYSSSGIGPSR